MSFEFDGTSVKEASGRVDAVADYVGATRNEIFEAWQNDIEVLGDTEANSAFNDVCHNIDDALRDVLEELELTVILLGRAVEEFNEAEERALRDVNELEKLLNSAMGDAAIKEAERQLDREFDPDRDRKKHGDGGGGGRDKSRS